MKCFRLFFLSLAMLLPVPPASVAGETPARSALPADCGGTEPRLHDNYIAWSRLPASRKESLGKNYMDFSLLSKEKKASIRSHYEQWKNLPESRRQDLRARLKKWQNIPEAERARLRESGAHTAGPDGRLAGRNIHP